MVVFKLSLEKCAGVGGGALPGGGSYLSRTLEMGRKH